MKLVCEITYGGSTDLRAVAASANLDSMANAIKYNPGIGKEFLYFANLPPGHPAMANWAMFPDWAGFGNVVTTDNAKNKAMLQAMLDLEASAGPGDPKPSDALTW